MVRKIGPVAIAALLLIGCGRQDDQKDVRLAMANSNKAVPALYAPPPPFVPPPDIAIQTDAPNSLFSQTHALTVAMARAAVASRYEAVRTACLKDKALKCVLTSAALTSGPQYSASLSLALPHEAVAALEKRLMAPLSADGGEKPEITAQSSAMENETRRAADVERQLAQAISYRDKLEELSKRANLSVEEVLKLHEALAQAQAAVENATAAKRATEADVRLEKMDITLEEKEVPPETSAFAGFWPNAGSSFTQSLADMLLWIFKALPWLPILVAGLWLVRWLWSKRRRSV